MSQSRQNAGAEGEVDGITGHLSETAHELLKHRIMQTEDGWGGWLGRYQTALRETTVEMEGRKKGDQTGIQHRRRDRSPDRGR